MNKMALIYTYSKTKVGHIQIDPFLNYLHKLLKSCQVRQSAFEISTFQMFYFFTKLPGIRDDNEIFGIG